MGAKRCPVCGSGEVSLWLGGSIGALYHCPECDYTGPVVIEGEPLDGLNENIAIPRRGGVGIALGPDRTARRGPTTANVRYVHGLKGGGLGVSAPRADREIGVKRKLGFSFSVTLERKQSQTEPEVAG